jgi:hypothetical protein
MSAGKGLSIAAGVLVLVATYALTWFIFTDAGTTYMAYGIGGIKSLPNMFVHPEAYGAAVGMEPFVTYIFAGIFIWFLVSGILLLIGAKVRGFAFAGATMPIVIACLIMLSEFGGPTTLIMEYVNAFGDPVYLIQGFVPFNFVLFARPESIGTYVLLIGGVLGLVSGFLTRKDKDEDEKEEK